VSARFAAKELLGDKGYGSESFRKSLEKNGTRPITPRRANRKKRIRHNKEMQVNLT
jgi:IS5 family transposase